MYARLWRSLGAKYITMLSNLALARCDDQIPCGDKNKSNKNKTEQKAWRQLATTTNVLFIFISTVDISGTGNDQFTQPAVFGVPGVAHNLPLLSNRRIENARHEQINTHLRFLGVWRRACCHLLGTANFSVLRWAPANHPHFVAMSSGTLVDRIELVSSEHVGRSAFYEQFYQVDSVKLRKDFEGLTDLDCIIIPCSNGFGIKDGVAKDVQPYAKNY
jgi:hypothetical protein